MKLIDDRHKYSNFHWRRALLLFLGVIFLSWKWRKWRKCISQDVFYCVNFKTKPKIFLNIFIEHFRSSNIEMTTLKMLLVSHHIASHRIISIIHLPFNESFQRVSSSMSIWWFSDTKIALECVFYSIFSRSTSNDKN